MLMNKMRDIIKTIILKCHICNQNFIFKLPISDIAHDIQCPSMMKSRESNKR